MLTSGDTLPLTPTDTSDLIISNQRVSTDLHRTTNPCCLPPEKYSV